MTSSSELKEAVQAGDTARVTTLLRAGASLVLDEHGVTALHQAVRLGNRPMAKLLLEHGADEYVLMGTSWPHVASPLLEAVKRGDAETVDLLIAHAARRIERGPQLGAGGPGGAREMGGSVKVARDRESTAGAKLQEHLDSALVEACSAGHVRVARVLLASGADPNCYPWSGQHRRRPLASAATAGFTDLVRALIEHGAAVDAQDEGRTALSRAVAARKDDVVEILVKAHADLNCRDETGTTPLHAAAAKGAERIVRLLLEGGADPNPENAKRETPLYVAPPGSEAARVLRSHGARMRPFWRSLLKRIWSEPLVG